MHKKFVQLLCLIAILTLGLTACTPVVTEMETITEEPRVEVENTKTPTATEIPPATETPLTEEIEESIEPTPMVDKEREGILRLHSAAMDYMEDTPPTFEDDFEVINYNWGVFTTFETGLAGLTRVSEFVHNGQLQFPGYFNEVHQGTHQGALDFNAENFILRYLISPQAGMNFFVIDLRGVEAEEMEDQLTVGLRSDRIDFENFGYQDFSFDPSQMYDLLIIAEYNILAVFVDGSLIMYNTSAETAGDFNLPIGQINGLDNGEDMLYIDYIGFWDLDGIDFELLDDATE